MMADAAVLHRGFSWQTLPGPWLVMTGVSVAVAMLCLALQGGDDRLINGVSVWHKPFKFALSFIFYFGTIALIARLLPQDFFRKVPGYTMLWAPVLCAVFELAYIGWQAGHGEPSHFNLSTPFSALMYSLMGVGAAVLVFVLLGLAAAVARHNSLRDPVVLAVVLGLCLSCVLGGAFGGYLSAQSGHWVNAAPTDASGLWLFRWARDGGDLRVAHFFGLHAMQVLPLFALLVRRLPWAVTLVAAGTLAYAGFTTLTFFQALRGEAFL